MVDGMQIFFKSLEALKPDSTAKFSVFTVTRIAALGRVLLALSLLMLSATDPFDMGFQSELDDLLAAAYLLFAFSVCLPAWRSWWFDFLFQPWFVLIDVLVFATLPTMIEPSHDGYRVAALSLAAFVLLSVGLRWDWKRSANVAIALNLINLMILVVDPLRHFHHGVSVGADHADHEHLRTIYYMFVVSTVIVFAVSRMNLKMSLMLKFSETLGTVEGSLSDALYVILKAVHATNGSICWMQHHGSCSVIHVDAGNISKPRKRPRCGADAYEIDFSACLFDLEANRCLLLRSDGGIEALGGNWAPPDAVAESGFRQGIIVPMRGMSGSGWMVVGDSLLPSQDILHYLANLAIILAIEFDRRHSVNLAREEELAQQRIGFARDLHDSVLQTIAGTRYWVNSMLTTSPNDSEFGSALARLDSVLDFEAKHLRALIDGLRKGPAAVPDRDPAAKMEQLTDALAVQWRVPITLDMKLNNALISDDIWLELNQLIREGVSNAVRHGAATKIAIAIVANDGSLELAIGDNGRGFTDPQCSDMPRMLTQRARHLGGGLSMESSELGTTAIISIPIGAAN